MRLIKKIFFYSILFGFSLPNFSFGQISKIKLDRVATNTPNDKQLDSLDHSSFCNQKQKEFDSLRTVIFNKIDSVKKQKQFLEDKHPGSRFYIGYSDEVFFNWEGCFSRVPRSDCDDCGLFAITISDIIDANFSIRNIEGGYHNSDGSQIYYDEIQRQPK